MRDAFLAEAIDSKRRDAAQNAAWFNRQATALKGRLGEAERRKAAFERANTIVLQDDDVDAESSKLRALASTAPAPAPVAAPPPAPAASPARPVSREGRKQIAGFFSPDMSLAMHMLARRQNLL